MEKVKLKISCNIKLIAEKDNFKTTEGADILFFITPRAGNWSDAQIMCKEQGGNLISESLKPELGFKRFTCSLISK